MIRQNCGSETLPYLFCQRRDAYQVRPEAGTRAGFARRFAATVLDLFLPLLCILVVTGIASGFGRAVGTTEDIRQGVANTTTLIGLAVYCFLSLLLFARGKTLGKAILGLAVVEKRNGDYPGLGRMIVREWFGKAISGLFFGIGLFWAIFDKDGQAWHEKIANTVVLNGRQVSTPRRTRMYWI
jgi:uncharacterized RDD family membrane protein YckC